MPENNNSTSKTRRLKRFLEALLQVLDVLRMCLFPFAGDKLQDRDHRSDKQILGLHTRKQSDRNQEINLQKQF